MYHLKTDAYHFRYGDYQGKKTGGWDCELHGSDPHQARRSASLPRELDLRPKTGSPSVNRSWTSPARSNGRAGRASPSKT